MNAISLWQPWASLLVGGEKRIETRSWPLRLPMPCVLAIHAAKKWNKDLERLTFTHPYSTCLNRCGFNFNDGDHLPFDAIIGFVRVKECRTTEELRPRLTGVEESFGDYGSGRFGWVCDEFCGLSFPVPCVGRQSIFQWEPPAGLLLPEWCRSGDGFPLQTEAG